MGRGGGLIWGVAPESWPTPNAFLPHLDRDRMREQRAVGIGGVESLLVRMAGRLGGFLLSLRESQNVGVCLRVRPLGYQFSAVLVKLRNWLYGASPAKRPLVAMETSQPSGGCAAPIPYWWGLSRHVAVLSLPSELVTAPTSPMRKQNFWIDSPAICDVLGGRSGIFLRSRRSLAHSGSSTGSERGATIAPRYGQVGRGAEKDPTDRQVWYWPPFRSGYYRRWRRWVGPRSSYAE